MNWMEQLLIIGGVSLDIFAAMERQGSMVAKIEKLRLAALSLLACIWQAVLFSAGRFLAVWLARAGQIAEREKMIGAGIAVMIYAGLGIHLVTKAVRRETVQEHREEHFDRSRVFFGFLNTGAYTLLAGFAFGFLEPGMAFGLAAVAACSVLAVIAGAYAGYRFGFARRKWAYWLAAALLWTAGFAILRRVFIF